MDWSAMDYAKLKHQDITARVGAREGEAENNFIHAQPKPRMFSCTGVVELVWIRVYLVV